MMEFDMVNRKVRIKAKSIIIDALNRIWEADKTEEKEEATKYLTYVHLVSQIDPEAPYYRSAFDEVRILAKRDIWKNYDHTFEEGEEEILEEAIDQYRNAYESVGNRTVRIFDSKIDQIRNVIDDTMPVITPSTVRGVTTYASNFPILNKMMQELTNLMDTKEALEARVNKKVSEDGTVRAGRSLSLVEKKLKEKKEANTRLTSDAQANEEDQDEEENPGF